MDSGNSVEDEIINVEDDDEDVGGLDKACRLCLTTEQSRSSIFGVPLDEVPFVEKIRACVDVEVKTNDKLSTLVCASCIDNINNWHSYKDSCIQAQAKLQEWFTKYKKFTPVITVKEEPADGDVSGDQPQPVVNEKNDKNHVETSNMEVDGESAIEPTNENDQAVPSQNEKEKLENDISPMVQVKSEPLDSEDEDDCYVDIDSANGSELLINPLAKSAANQDRVMEADSTQRASSRTGMKKKLRRGPHTHFRGAKLFKKKCAQCNIVLHSKFSYTQHMSRYHGIVNNVDDSDKAPSKVSMKAPEEKLAEQAESISETEEVEDMPVNSEEEQYVEMLKTEPLKQLQRNIISQLKTFSCYTCKQTFFDRRHTLNHIRQHMNDLRPYTCIACLTEFSDRSMYKLHCGASFECAMKIALVTPKVGKEQYFTCNMCLRSFDNRKELLSHLAMHADKQYKQLTQPLRSPPKLKPITPQITSSRVESPSKRNVCGPYMNGDPAHNHMCDLCGMIYRYKPNMIKHRELCSSLADDVRTSYRCIHCSMTFLVFKKFYTHVFSEHKKREITCFKCLLKFPTNNEYLSHHQMEHMNQSPENTNEIPIEKSSSDDYSMDVEPLDASQNPADVSEKPFHCALCGENFATKIELTEHRNLHLKVKIYSCVICRSMFSSSTALEQHMKCHGIHDSNSQKETDDDNDTSQNAPNNSRLSARSDPGITRFNHCFDCGKNFSNIANLKRHQRTVHSYARRRWDCDECKRRFYSIEEYNLHVKTHGPQPVQPVERPKPLPPPVQMAQPAALSLNKQILQCPKCPRTFTYQGNLIVHCQNVHNIHNMERIPTKIQRPVLQSILPRPTPKPTSRGYACDICGKAFREEQSLKTHRGWHLRINHRMKSDMNMSMPETTIRTADYTMTMTPLSAASMSSSTPKPAKAKKSFPNNPSQQQLNIVGPLQCQVCDDRFSEVSELRTHLWEVHCARNKPDKASENELQCELCPNKFPDQESLDEHMTWHSQNPILTDATNTDEMVRKTFYCDICGKYYSNRKVFMRHKKLHKVLPSTSVMNLQSLQAKRRYCSTCNKNFATEASLRRHKASSSHQEVLRMQVPSKRLAPASVPQQQHLPTEPIVTIKTEPDMEYMEQEQFYQQQEPQQQSTKKRPVTCHVCKLIFPNMSVLYQHKQLAHNKVAPVNKEKSQSGECVPLVSAEGLVCCNVCGKQFPGISNLKQHFAHKHKAKTNTYPCYSPGCKLVFTSAHSLKNHETTHSSLIFNCNLCDRHVFTKVAMTKHMLTMHKAIYQSGTDKSALWSETDLTNYTIKNCQGTLCPKCKVKYPNLRALKIHYLKFHDKA